MCCWLSCTGQKCHDRLSILHILGSLNNIWLILAKWSVYVIYAILCTKQLHCIMGQEEKINYLNSDTWLSPVLSSVDKSLLCCCALISVIGHDGLNRSRVRVKSGVSSAPSLQCPSGVSKSLQTSLKDKFIHDVSGSFSLSPLALASSRGINVQLWSSVYLLCKLVQTE